MHFQQIIILFLKFLLPQFADLEVIGLLGAFSSYGPGCELGSTIVLVNLTPFSVPVTLKMLLLF